MTDKVRDFRDELRRVMDLRGLAPRTVAEIVGLPEGDVIGWLDGSKVPPKARFGRLCSMIHSDQRACRPELEERWATAKPRPMLVGRTEVEATMEVDGAVPQGFATIPATAAPSVETLTLAELAGLDLVRARMEAARAKAARTRAQEALRAAEEAVEVADRRVEERLRELEDAIALEVAEDAGI